MSKTYFTTKRLTYLGMFIALSYVLSFIKIQGSIGIDSIPAFFAAIVMGPLAGAIVAFFGHMVTALVTGFPHTLPLHLVTAIMMFITCYSFGVARKLIPRILADICGIVMNAVVSLAIVAIVNEIIVGIGSGAGMGLFKFLIVSLLIGSTISVVMAEVLDEFVFKNTKIFK